MQPTNDDAAAPREVRLDLLLGRTVVDAAGARVGKLEEVRAARRGDECVALQFLVGSRALLERLALEALRGSVLGRLLPRRSRYEIPWELMDLSDPEHPRLTVRKDEVELARV